MMALRVAISSLTILPVGVQSPSYAQISASRAYYPLVGALLGLLMAGMAIGLDPVFPDVMISAVLVVALLVATRGLHLDGLMDTCDGLLGSHTKERRLEIMRDTQVGAFGVVGAISVVLLKWTALASLLSLARYDMVLVLIIFPIASRWGMVVSISSFSYARPDGLGVPFKEGPRVWATVVAGVIALVASLALGGVGGVLIFSIATGVAWLLGRGMVVLLGGLTGDTYGAINEIIEVVALVAGFVLISYGMVVPVHEQLFGV